MRVVSEPSNSNQEATLNTMTAVWAELDTFEWAMLVEVMDREAGTATLEVLLLVSRKRQLGASHSWGPWTAFMEDIRSFLRLWLMELATRGRPAKGKNLFEAEQEKKLLVFTKCGNDNDVEVTHKSKNSTQNGNSESCAINTFSKRYAAQKRTPRFVIGLPCNKHLTYNVEWSGSLSDTTVRNLCGLFILNQFIFALAAKGFIPLHPSPKRSGNIDRVAMILVENRISAPNEAFVSVAVALDSAAKHCQAIQHSPKPSAKSEGSVISADVRSES
ncbi:hypothetical protein EX30DRAFT_350626 [Ascodesmis nigricans]|uniref:Uncharacterized protein n=1 Tax=Ascodesmis nigricans TaxID=341454 RepID=A0A4S2MRT1_9PEZI|nr:hypothetical protein EX30DRAFT_350626 [Ascodesmis nigricans]